MKMVVDKIEEELYVEEIKGIDKIPIFNIDDELEYMSSTIKTSNGDIFNVSFDFAKNLKVGDRVKLILKIE